jgi:hypothetical protein
MPAGISQNSRPIFPACAPLPTGAMDAVVREAKHEPPLLIPDHESGGAHRETRESKPLGIPLPGRAVAGQGLPLPQRLFVFP